VLVAYLLALIGLPQVSAFTSVRSGHDAFELHTVRVENMTPGDTHHEILEITNETEAPKDYQLVFVRQGGLWNCDPAGNNLDYELSWSPGADRHLEIGETETLTITSNLPISAGNQCQGLAGRLIIHEGSIQDGNNTGVYECRSFPLTEFRSVELGFSASMDELLCWDLIQDSDPFLTRW
jgi:hypothetical protein